MFLRSHTLHLAHSIDVNFRLKFSVDVVVLQMAAPRIETLQIQVEKQTGSLGLKLSATPSTARRLIFSICQEVGFQF
jgi:hypothetical protein